MKKYAKNEKYANFHFFSFYKIGVFTIYHISITDQEIMKYILFDSLVVWSLTWFPLLEYKLVCFGLGPTWTPLVYQSRPDPFETDFNLRTAYTQLPKLLQQSVI